MLATESKRPGKQLLDLQPPRQLFAMNPNRLHRQAALERAGAGKQRLGVQKPGSVTPTFCCAVAQTHGAACFASHTQQCLKEKHHGQHAQDAARQGLRVCSTLPGTGHQANKKMHVKCTVVKPWLAELALQVYSWNVWWYHHHSYSLFIVM